MKYIIIILYFVSNEIFKHNLIVSVFTCGRKTMIMLYLYDNMRLKYYIMFVVYQRVLVPVILVENYYNRETSDSDGSAAVRVTLPSSCLCGVRLIQKTVKKRNTLIVDRKYNNGIVYYGRRFRLTSHYTHTPRRTSGGGYVTATRPTFLGRRGNNIISNIGIGTGIIYLYIYYNIDL